MCRTGEQKGGAEQGSRAGKKGAGGVGRSRELDKGWAGVGIGVAAPPRPRFPNKAKSQCIHCTIAASRDKGKELQSACEWE